MLDSHKIVTEEQIDHFEETCREAGLKITHQRLEIFKELASRADHPSADMVYRSIKEKMPTVALDTVYRTLATFEHYGLIARVMAFDDHARFDADLYPHHHMVCTECGSIMDFCWEKLDGLDTPPEAGAWGSITHRHIVLRGICRDCMSCR